MRKFIILFLIFSTCSLIEGCPACVGTVQHNSPPFFADEFYEQSITDNDYSLISTSTDF